MREIDRLSEFEVKKAKPDKGKFVKRLLDGAGLYLQITKSGSGGVNKNWIFRYELDGERHDLGLGPLHTVGLSDARRRAAELRLQILDGIDPRAGTSRPQGRTARQKGRADQGDDVQGLRRTVLQEAPHDLDHD